MLKTTSNQTKGILKWEVPQGSIWGFILFLCYNTDLSQVIVIQKIVSYVYKADDSNLKLSGKPVGELDISVFMKQENVCQFLKTNHPFLNTVLQKPMAFPTRQNQNRIKRILETDSSNQY